MKKTLFVDLNNLAIRNFFVQKQQIELQRYTIFHQIYLGFNKFKCDEVVLAVDSGRQWRKLVYNGYKGSRKKTKDPIWDEFFEFYGSFVEEMRNNFPFKVLKVPRCEADDIIAVLSNRGKGVIYSADSDYIQLVNDNVSFYHVYEKKMRKREQSLLDYLNEQFIRGQGKDDIPNIFTDNNWPEGKRKPAVTKKRLNNILTKGLDEWAKENNCEANLRRNRLLIDYENIPKKLQTRIIESYTNYSFPSPEKIYEYISNQGWRHYLKDFTITENTLLKLY